MINEYDKVRLKTGEIVRISEILGNGEAYVIEYFKPKRGYITDQVTRDEIASVFIETEMPLVTA